MASVGMTPISSATVPSTSLSWSRSQNAGNPGAILKAGSSATPARSPAALAARAEAGPTTTQPSPATSAATNGKPASASAASGSSSALVATRKSRAAEALEKAKQEIPPFAPADIYVVEFKPRNVLRNLSPAELYEQAIAHEEGNFIVSSGALATLSGRKTGRSPKDKRVVKEKAHADDVWWGKGSPNMEMDEYTFMMNREQAIDYLNTLDKVYVQDMFIGADTKLRLRVRIVCARAYHALFMHNMCIRPTDEELANFGEPDFTIYNAGHLPANRLAPYMTSATSIDIDLNRMEMVILGTEYAGEMKKGLFSLMNYLMPKQGNLSLHSGANMGMEKGDVSLFFGLSGTGKTTLSTDPNRYLIGDDEHVWSENGISNIEGGCYAKCINLSKENEPDIYNAIRFGSVLENVVFDPHTRVVDFADDSITENTRVSYPVDYIPNALIPGVAGHPTNIILLTCDAFGVLPPVSRLTVEQTMYHFISGYTAKVAGTEEGVTEPEATFSACFGAAFMVWHPYKYASLLAEKMQKHGATAWLVNTGWTAGGYGVGHRMKIKDTRAIIDAIHDGSLTADNGVEYVKTPVFGLQVPTTCAGVAPEVLQPEMQWEDKEAYRNTLEKLGKLFQKNFSKFMEFEMGGETYDMPEAVVEAGPRL